MITFPHTRRELPQYANRALRVFYQLLLLTCVLTVLGLLGHYSWVVDLTSHFRMQYFLFQLLGMGVLVLARSQYRWLAPVALCAGLNFGFLMPFISIEPVTQAAAPQPSIRVLHMNVLKYGNDYDGVVKFIHDNDPDVLSLQEISPKWQKALDERGVLKDFAYQDTEKYAEIGLYSRLPVLDSEVIAAGPGQMAAVHARVMLGDRPVSVIVMHPPAPVNVAYATKQRVLFDVMTGAYEEPGRISPDSMVIGDLNTTPFAWPYRRFVDETGLRNFREDRGYLPSWPSVVPVFWIPIDHILLSDDWVVDQVKLGPAIGSDHLPVRVDMHLKG